MTTQQPRERTRWRVRRWGKRILKWLGLPAGLVILAVFVLLHSLDRPWVKRRVQAIVAKEAGVAIDYGAVRLALTSGIDIDDLVVSSPPEVRGAAPELARIGHVTARWSLGSLLADETRVARVALSDVAVTIAVDENGRTSLDALSPPSKEPSTPLSHRAASLLGSPLPVGEVEIDRLSVTLVSTDHGTIADRTVLRGVDVQLHGEPVETGGGARLRLGSESAPLAVDLERSGTKDKDGTAHARLWALAAADPSDAALTVDLRLVDQTLVSGVGVARALHAAARAHFDAAGARTDVTASAEVADGTGRVEVASATIPDEGPVVVHCAVGDVDAAGLLALLPPDLVPVHVDRASVRYRVVEATLATPPRLNEGGAIDVQGDVAGLRMALAGGGSLRVDNGALRVHMLPDPSATAGVHGSVTVDGVDLSSSAGETKTGTVEIQIDGRGSPDGAFDGTVALDFTSVQSSSSAAVEARDGHLALHLADVHADLDDALATRGDLALTGDVASVSLRSASSGAVASKLAVHAHVPLSGRAPFAASLEVTAGRLQLAGRAREPLADAPARFALDVTNATPDLAHPIASTGTARLEVALGETKATIDAGKQADAVDYELHAKAPSLEPARPLLPADSAALVPLGRMALAIESKGRVERISSELPEIRQHTKLEVAQPGFGSIAARALAVTLDSHGNATRHEADLDIGAQALEIAGVGTDDDHLTISAKMDRAQPALHLVVAEDGRATAKLTLEASFDRARHALVYDLEGSASKLAALAPLIAGTRGLESVDLSALEVGFAAKGELFGVVSEVGADGTVRIEPNPTASAAVTGTMDARVLHFGYSRGDVAVAVPRIAWHADLGSGPRRTLKSHLDVGSAHLAVGPHVLDVAAITDQLSATVTGDLLNPDADLEDHVTLSAVRQDFARVYRVGDVAVDLSVRRDHRGVVRLGGLRIANAAGGTKLSLTGNLDVSGARRTVALRGEIEQDLARLSTDTGEIAGRGRASVTTRVESGDLIVYRTRTDVHLDGVDLSVPHAGVTVEAADGEIPIQLELRVAADGVTLVRNHESSPYSLLRFSDQHPLLSKTSFLSARSITTPWVSMAPFAANLQIDRNIVALAQLEMGIRGGRVTGECALDYDGEDSKAELHVRANGVRSSHDEPFDGNAALAVSVRDRSVDGRAEILRIGKRHLLDLLDVVDPIHTNASINRVRSSLSLGYPDRVSLAFDHGFASAHIELGGLASLLSISDIRGIPTGPLVERMLKPSRSKGRR